MSWSGAATFFEARACQRTLQPRVREQVERTSRWVDLFSFRLPPHGLTDRSRWYEFVRRPSGHGALTSR